MNDVMRIRSLAMPDLICDENPQLAFEEQLGDLIATQSVMNQSRIRWTSVNDPVMQ